MSRSSFSSGRFSSRLAPFAIGAAILSVAALGGTALADAAVTHAGHHRGHHGHHDLLRAAEKLPDLTQAQKDQITKLEEAEHASGQAVHTAERNLAKAVADQVDANKIDRAALAAPIKAVSDAETAATTARHTAVDGLHALLTPTQRTELANGVDAKVDEHAAKEQAEHAQNTQNAKAGGHAHGGGVGGPWARALGLSPAQEQQIKASAASASATTPAATPPTPAEREARVKKYMDDFKGATFSAAAEPAPPANARRSPGHWVDLAQAALPVLSDAQRTELANLLRGPT